MSQWEQKDLDGVNSALTKPIWIQAITQIRDLYPPSMCEVLGMEVKGV